MKRKHNYTAEEVECVDRELDLMLLRLAARGVSLHKLMHHVRPLQYDDLNYARLRLRRTHLETAPGVWLRRLGTSDDVE